MNIYQSFDEIPHNRDSVITVGTFDGLHLGHQKIINRLKEIAGDNNMRDVLMTIHPHPQIVLQKPSKAPIQLLTSISERLSLLESFGVSNTLIIPFSYEFSHTTPEEFVRNYLYEKVGFKKILIGYDHMFGKNRKGNPELLTRLSKELSFEMEKVEAFAPNDQIVSSTQIRKALANNQIEEANKMLGYNYVVRGSVVEGQGLGRKFGFPTANIKPPYSYKLMPAVGVYLVSSVIDSKRVFGMANIGYRPTVANDDRPLLEINYFDFDKDLYDKELTVDFHKFIRDEQKFDGVDQLIEQIKKDEETCRKIIKNKILSQNALKK